jgi:hypothetical protein
VKGVFPQAVSVLRGAIEAVGVYTHLHCDPRKIDSIEEDSDSLAYRYAFVSTKDKAVIESLKGSGIRYRFLHCSSPKGMSSMYRLLSGYYVHTGSLKSLVANSPPSEKDLPCFFVDRCSPEKLQDQYNLVQSLMASLVVELLSAIPEDDLMEDEIAHLSLTMPILLPLLSSNEDELDSEASALIERGFEVLKRTLSASGTEG